MTAREIRLDWLAHATAGDYLRIYRGNCWAQAHE